MNSYSNTKFTHVPVAVFAFRRLDVLSAALSALERCEGFDGTVVHVFSDSARDNRPDEVADVKQVRAWLHEWCSRTGASLFEASSNKGLRRSIVDGVSVLLERHDRVIVLEDDIVVSRTFLRFMNSALEAYDKRHDIVQISGNFVPHKQALPAIGLLRMPGCWGWATWRRAWKNYNDDASHLLTAMSERDTFAFDMQGSYGNLEALQRNAEGTLDTWFVRWYASVFLQGGLSVYPGRSLTRNIGFGGMGTNCSPGPVGRVLSNQRLHNTPRDLDWSSIGSSETPAFAATVERFYRWQQHQWTKPTLHERLKARLATFSRKSV
jgi:hypothetical protein